MDLSLRRFTIRQKLWGGGIAVVLLFMLLGGMNIKALLLLQHNVSDIVRYDEPSLRHILQVKANVHQSSTHISLYLSDRDEHHKHMAFAELDEARRHLTLLLDIPEEERTAGSEIAIESLQAGLDAIEVVYRELLDAAKSDLSNIPALSFSAEHINPHVFNIIESLNAVAGSDPDLEDPAEAAALMRQITNLRFTWTRIAADLRAYIAYRSPELIDNLRIYIQGAREMGTQLLERIDELPFEHQESIVQLSELESVVEQNIEKMLQMHSVALWKRDMQITTNQMSPLLRDLDMAIEELVAAGQQHMVEEGQEALLTTKETNQMILLLVPTFAVFGLALLFLMIRSITNPMCDAVSAMDDIASGSGNLNRRMSEDGRDEVSRLAQGFNAFVSKIKGVVDLVIVSSTSLAEESGRMHKTTDRSREQVADQQLHINEIGSLVDDMANAANQASDKARSAADSARESERHAKAGRETVSTVLTAMRQLADEVQQSTGSIEQVAENSRNIGGVLSVIRGFSEQTNLLALNAAIEAARAGENGRGFAVVADEVRSLAAKIHQETDSIERIISALQDNTRNAVELMQHSSEQTVLLVDRADQADEALTAITDSVTEIARTNDEITSLTDTQQQHTDQVQQRVVSLREIAGQSAESVNQAANSANEFTIMAGQLQDLVQQFLLDEKRAAKTKKTEDTAAATDAEPAADADEDDITLF